MGSPLFMERRKLVKPLLLSNVPLIAQEWVIGLFS